MFIEIFYFVKNIYLNKLGLRIILNFHACMVIVLDSILVDHSFHLLLQTF